MPSLGEFLGALLADASRARVQADMEAVRIAAAYTRDPLLRYLPVPRFRLPDITVEIPVLIVEFRGGPESVTTRPFDEPTAAELRAAVRAALQNAGIRVPRAAVSRIPAELVERAHGLFQSENLRMLNPTAVADDVAGMLVEIVQANVEPALTEEQAEQLRRSMRDATASLLATKLRPSLSWQVAVTAGEIKAHEDRESIVRLRLTISEDGYEVLSRDGGPDFVLTPE